MDFSSYQMSVVIVDNDGQQWPLWMRNTGQVATALVTSGGDTTTLSGADLSIVESVEIDVSLGLSVNVSIGIACDFDLGLRIMSSPLLKIDNTYEVQLGYPRDGRFLPWIRTIANMPSFHIDGDNGFTATLTGHGGTFAATRGASTRVFTNETYRNMIITLIQPYGWAIDFPTSTGPSDPLDIVRPTVSMNGESDWYFIQRIVRLAMCDSVIEANPDGGTGPSALFFRVIRREVSYGTPPIYSFVLRGRCDFDRSFPILELDSMADLIFAPRASTGVRSADVHPDTGQEQTVTSTPSTSSVPVLADGVLSTENRQDRGMTQPRTGPESTGAHVPVSARDPGTPQQIATSIQQETGSQGMRMTIKTVGLTNLIPGEVVSVVGAAVIDGNYRIESLKHSAGDAEWSTTLTLVNNGFSSALLPEWASGTPPALNTIQAPPPRLDGVSGASTEVRAVPEG